MHQLFVEQRSRKFYAALVHPNNGNDPRIADFRAVVQVVSGRMRATSENILVAGKPPGAGL